MAAVAAALLKGGVAGSTSDDCRELGNSMLACGKHEDAIYFYTLGLTKKSDCHLLMSNRSAAHAKMGAFDEALKDAEQCVKLMPSWARGHSRLGAALEGLGRLEEGLSSYEAALKIDGGNAGLQQSVAALKRKISGEMEPEPTPSAQPQESVQVKKEDAPPAEPAAPQPAAPAGEVKQEAEAPAREEAAHKKQEATPVKEEPAAPIKEEPAPPAELTPLEKAKARGNRAFAASNFEDAIHHYSDALELDKGNYALFSNRSAAYAGAGQMQSALNDAQKCINLKPDWAKGYGRKAVALRGLNRIPMAIAAYKDGLRIDPENKGLLDGLAILQPPAPTQEVKKEGDDGKEGEEGKEGAKEGDTQMQDATPAPPKAPSPPPMDEAELELLSSFLSETSSLERKQQVERIIKYKLNPLEVLQLKPEACTEEEMNIAYRKMSLMVHPDKCKHPRAEEAFELCKKSLAELQDEDKRQFYTEIAGAARDEAVRELKKKRKREKEEASKNKKMRVGDVDKLRQSMLGGGLRRKKDKEVKPESWVESADAEELTKEDEDMLVHSTREAAYRILTQLEKRRSRAEKVFIENEKRTKEALQESREKYKHEETQEKEWNQDRLDRIDSWRDFAKNGKKMGIRKPKPAVTEKGVSVLPPTMGGFRKSKEEQELDSFMGTVDDKSAEPQAEEPAEAAGEDDLDAFLDSV